MNLLEVKKNKNKNIFFLYGAIFCSFFIHFCIFVLFYNNNKKNIPYSASHDKNIVHLNIVSTNQSLNISQQARNLPKMQISNKENKKTKPISHKKNLVIYEQHKEEISNLDTVNSEEKINSQEKDLNYSAKIINPFGNLKLPKSVLGQNLFPKRYKVSFNLKTNDNLTKTFSIAKFIPLENNNQYLDRIIEKAFLTQLQILDKTYVSQWLELQYQNLYTSENTGNMPRDNFFIVLEFQEPN